MNLDQIFLKRHLEEHIKNKKSIFLTDKLETLFNTVYLPGVRNKYLLWGNEMRLADNSLLLSTQIRSGDRPETSKFPISLTPFRRGNCTSYPEQVL